MRGLIGLEVLKIPSALSWGAGWLGSVGMLGWERRGVMQAAMGCGTSRLQGLEMV